MTAPAILPSFPVNEAALEAVLHGMAGAYTVDQEGNHVLVPVDGKGGDFSMDDVLHFYSGYDPEKVVPYTGEDGHTHDDIMEYVGGTLYTRDCVIRALIAEVRRLRMAAHDG